MSILSGKRHRASYLGFSAKNLGKMTVREVSVIHWTDRGQFDLSINVKEQLANETVGGYFISQRMNVGFEKTPTRRFYVKRLCVIESTATFNIGYTPTIAETFRAQEPILIVSRENGAIRLVLKDYKFEQLEANPEQQKTEDDPPF